MKRLLLLIFSLSLSLATFCQETESQEEDSVVSAFVSSVGIYLDYGKLLTLPTNFEDKFEMGLELTLAGRLMLLGEAGYARITPQNAYRNANYEVRGNYYRAGLAYVGRIKAGSNFYLGGMYGWSFYSDQGVLEIESPSGLFGSIAQPFERTDLTANWYEFIFGTETEFWKNVFLGFVFRLRVMQRFDQFEDFEVYTIPGYGRSFDKSIPALNLHIKYRIPFYRRRN